MNDSEYRVLVEANWRRGLNNEEQARLAGWLAAHPEAHSDWEAETALNQTLTRLPDAPLSSNFTGRVLGALVAEEATAARQPSFFHQLRTIFRTRSARLAWALLGITFVWFGLHQYQKASRQELATGLAALANVAALPDPRALQDLDAVQQLSQLPAREDEELFTVLSQ